jgi:hypothetical protein
VAVLDVAAHPVVVAHVHDEVVFPRDLVALDDCRKVLFWFLSLETSSTPMRAYVA